MKFILPLVIFAFASHAALAEVEWIPGHGNSAHTGYYAMQTNQGNFRLLWKADLTMGDKNYDHGSMTSAFVIADDKIIYSTSAYDPVNQFHAFIAALDSNSGKLVWRTDHPCGYLDISYSLGKVIYAAEYCGKNWELRIGAYDIASGASLYATPIPKPIGPILPFADAAYYDASNTPSYISYNPVNNQILWENKDDNMRKSIAKIAVDNSYFVAQSDINKITVISRLSGELKYQMNLPGYMGNSVPTLDNKSETLYITSRDSSPNSVQGAALHAIDLNQRYERWVVYNQSFVFHPVVTDNMVYSVDNANAKVEAINPITGKIEWTWSPPADDAVLEEWVNMAATSDVLFVAGKHRLYAVSLTTHTTIWQLNETVEAIALAKNKLVVVTANDETSNDHKLVKVYALN